MLHEFKKIDRSNIVLSLAFIVSVLLLLFSWNKSASVSEPLIYSLSSSGPIEIFFQDQRVSTKIYQKDGVNQIDFTSKAKPEPVTFLANTQTDVFLDIFRRLTAIKKLRNVSSDDLKEFELQEPAAYIDVSDGTSKVKIEVGARNYASNEVYIKLAGQGDVYLLNSGFLQTLANPQARLKLFTPFYFKFEDLSKIEVELIKERSVNKVFTRSEYNNQGELIWTQEGTSQSGFLGTWIDSLEKLQMVDSATDFRDGKPVLIATFYEQSSRVDSLTIYKLGKLYYGETDRIKQPIEFSVSRVESLINAFEGL